MRVLYIEDDEGLLYLLRQSLEDAAIEMTGVTDGESGLNLLKGELYDAIIIDQELPEMTGVQMIERLQGLEAVPPIVMVTGAGTEEIAVQAMRAGASDYIVKDSKLAYLQLLPSKIRQVIRERELKQAQQAAERALQLEKDRSTLLTRFIQDASHEFRTPLSIIHTSTELLSYISESPKQKAYIQRIQQQADSILVLVTDLIKLAELDAKVSIDLTVINLNRFIEELIPQFDRVRREAEVEFSVSLLTAPLFVSGNVYELKDGISEIVDNACRYSAPGSKVFLSLTREGDNAELTIHDTGTGISEADLPHIFERFYRADQAHSSRGFGLGLSIAERIVELHSGSIRVESEVGSGTTVIVQLPLKNSEETNSALV